MTPLPESPRVRLRDATLDDADLLDAWNRDRSEFNDFGFEPEPIDREVLARGPLRDEHNGLLIVEVIAEGRPIGTVGWHKVQVRAESRVSTRSTSASS